MLNHTPESSEKKSPVNGDEKQQPASRSGAANNPQLSHIMQLQRTIGNRAVSQMLQRRIDHDAPNYEDKNGRAGKVSVENIRGTSLGPGANAPRVEPIGWRELHDGGHTLAHPDSTGYNAVRMHLWNGRLDGPGDEELNLAPGPAQINSLMSAGPEQSAKEAVDQRGKIWLETEVSYQNDNVQANDFTSVVPNEISMDWGYMNGNNRGAAEVTWSETIDQPAGALTDDQKDEYRELDDEEDLDDKLSTASNQEIAQAYNLVIPDLQKYMLLNYDTIFLGMLDEDRETALSTLDENEVIALINMLGYSDDHIAINFYVLNNLLDDTTLLQDVFKKFSADLQYRIVTYVGEQLLFDLEDYGTELIKAERRYFAILSEEEKYNTLDSMDEDEIDNLFLARIDNNLFENWARSRGNNSDDEAESFFEDNVSKALLAKLQARVLRYWQNKRRKI
ncbi:hypothetical protein [Paenibacillus aestuarii]|uniref:Uncharacterized protein n=1 Tax=Paenibacillus aestuarii TaxID=516965 RepID=A0ABW0KAL0_9BACL|nr:hypothetical protein [Paenibacillus aestuarii]